MSSFQPIFTCIWTPGSTAVFIEKECEGQAAGCHLCLKWTQVLLKEVPGVLSGQTACAPFVWTYSWSRSLYPAHIHFANPASWRQWTSPTCAARFAGNACPLGLVSIVGTRHWSIWICGNAYRKLFRSSVSGDYRGLKMMMSAVSIL